MAKEITGYELSRNWFDFCYENPELVSPTHTALYFFAIEHCNRLGWKPKFGMPTQMSMDAIGVKNWRTYSKAFNDIVDWGFFKVIERSKNQYSATIIAIVKNAKAHTKALSKATQKHNQKQGNSIVVVDKPLNQLTKEHINIEFDTFWDLYDKKRGDKEKIKKKWYFLSDLDRQNIISYIPKYIESQPEKKFRKDPITFLNNKSWNDEIIGTNKITKPINTSSSDGETNLNDYKIPHGDMFGFNNKQLIERCKQGKYPKA